MFFFKVKPLLLLFLLGGLFLNRCIAWETDQYTLPEQHLAEIGGDVSAYIHQKLTTSLLNVNQSRLSLPLNISRLQEDLSHQQQLLEALGPFVKKEHPDWRRDDLLQKIQQLQIKIKADQDKFATLQTEQGVVQLIAEVIGRPVAEQEKEDAIWGNVTDLAPYPSGIKNGALTAYYPERLDTVYAFAGFHRILHPSYFILSSTIKLYGIELGMDKLGHFLNQGVEYYSQFIISKKMGLSDQDAMKSAVKWGVETEDSYYGSWVSGIYSNADLASNYAGLYFYLNLFKAITINQVTYPAILSQDNKGNYLISQREENQPELLLKRFISFHMNEALNPSSLEYLQYVVVKKAVKSRCSMWQRKYPNANEIQAHSDHLSLWNNEDYGFRSTYTISIYDSCFASLQK